MRYTDRSHAVGDRMCFCRDPESHVVPLGAFAIPVDGNVNMNAPLNSGLVGVWGMEDPCSNCGRKGAHYCTSASEQAHEMSHEMSHEQAMQRLREYRHEVWGMWSARIAWFLMYVLIFVAGVLFGASAGT